MVVKKLKNQSINVQENLIKEAEKVFLQNFKAETWFERAIFFSWACKLKSCCKYCYMSTLPKEKRTKEKVRSFASLLAETVLCKHLGWKIGFLSGGIGIFSNEEIISLLSKMNEILNEKIWINIGTMDETQLKELKPYIEGVVGTVEVLDPSLHKEICPSKPLEDVERMFRCSQKLHIKNGMTLIVGLGETTDDFNLLKKFIQKYDIQKIHIYGLNPQKGTEFENALPPTPEYQAEWIARTRITFPKIDIQMGIWKDRVSRVGLLLKAGANSISKFPATSQFGTRYALEIEKQAALAGRRFKGTMTKMPKVDWKKEIEDLSFDSTLKKQISHKLEQYLAKMQRNTTRS